jgi:hypothetical protein
MNAMPAKVILRKQPIEIEEMHPVPADAGPLLSELDRPRYFSGQYLSDEELTLEQEYFRQKMRRHNLFLHGSGVVAGLDVTCGPGDGYITVGRGYAIDGCGDDIYVPAPVPYNVIPNLPGAPRDKCRDAANEKSACQLFLYIQYAEEPDRLRRSVPPGACTGNGHCEPSRIRESFTLRLSDNDERVVEPDLVDAIEACVKEMLQSSGIIRVSAEVVVAIEQAQAWDDNLHQQLLAAYGELQGGLLKVTTSGQIACTARDDLARMRYPVFPDPQYPEKALQAFARLYDYAFNTLWNCACEALLIQPVGCRTGNASDVLLAEITVLDGAVVKICNHPRHHVKTFRSVEYWLSPLTRLLMAPFNYLLRVTKSRRQLRGPSDLIELACCAFDFSLISHRLAAMLLSNIKETPVAVQKHIATSREAIGGAKAQVANVRERIAQMKTQIVDNRPVIWQRMGTMIEIQKARPMEASQKVTADTGLAVVGTTQVDRANLFNLANLRATAEALTTRQPVEIAYTTSGIAFLRTRAAAAPQQPPATTGGPVIVDTGPVIVDPAKLPPVTVDPAKTTVDPILHSQDPTVLTA